jgi:hypothetical protein
VNSTIPEAEQLPENPPSERIHSVSGSEDISDAELDTAIRQWPRTRKKREKVVKKRILTLGTLSHLS